MRCAMGSARGSPNGDSRLCAHARHRAAICECGWPHPRHAASPACGFRARPCFSFTARIGRWGGSAAAGFHQSVLSTRRAARPRISHPRTARHGCAPACAATALFHAHLAQPPVSRGLAGAAGGESRGHVPAGRGIAMRFKEDSRKDAKAQRRNPTLCAFAPLREHQSSRGRRSAL